MMNFGYVAGMWLAFFIFSIFMIVGIPLFLSFFSTKMIHKNEKELVINLAKFKIADLVRVRIQPHVHRGAYDGRIGIVKRFFESRQGNCYAVFFTREGEERIFEEYELEKV